MLNEPWRIQFFGSFRVTSGSRQLVRFRTHRAAVLLAYLAYYLNKEHAREALAEMLWPDVDPLSARTSLRQELASLRRQLEPPGVPSGTVIRATRSSVQLNPSAVITDVGDFALATWKANRAPAKARANSLKVAVGLYHGELLPGWYEEWVLTERTRLEGRYLALRRLVREAAGSEEGCDRGPLGILLTVQS